MTINEFLNELINRLLLQQNEGLNINLQNSENLQIQIMYASVLLNTFTSEHFLWEEK